jgi:O-methyltransferase
MIKITVKKIIKEILFASPLRKNYFPRYYYNFEAPQLCFLCECIENTKDVPGSVAEVGCQNGATPVFLNKYMNAQQIEKEYYAVDTFSGFVSDDVKYEIANRGKGRSLFTSFQVNSKKWFDGTMDLNGIKRVKSIQADVNKYDLAALAPLSFVLLDVDLYRPMKKSMKDLYRALSPGGIMIVDDCTINNIRYDGSDQAYKEFVQEIDQPVRVVHGKLGVINKPPAK